MIAIIEEATGNVERIVIDTDGLDMEGRVAVEVPADYDPVAVSHVWRDGAWVDNLDAARASALAQANTAAEALRARFLTAGSGQAMTYLRKEDEARRFDPEGDAADYPFLAAEAASTGATLADTAALVLAQANSWATLGAAIEGHRRGLVVAIDAAEDMAALNALDTRNGWPGGPTEDL